MLKILLSETSVALPRSVELEEDINAAWQGLADFLFDPSFIIAELGDFIKNPLCLAVLSALLCVAAFHIFTRLISYFRGKGV